MAVIKNPLTIVQGEEPVVVDVEACALKFGNEVVRHGTINPNETEYTFCDTDGNTLAIPFKGSNDFQIHFRIIFKGIAGRSGEYPVLLRQNGWNSGDGIVIDGKYDETNPFFELAGTMTNNAGFWFDFLNYKSHLNEWIDVDVSYISETKTINSRVVFEDGSVDEQTKVLDYPIKEYASTTCFLNGNLSNNKLRGKAYIDTAKSFIKVNNVVLWGED